MPLLVRTWNIFHGNSVPPARETHLEAMIRLASADEPDVLCLQEVPVWALERLGEWSGMQVFGAVAQRPHLGPLPSHAALGRELTKLHPGLLRSAFTGQANAILTNPACQAGDHRTLVLNPLPFRRKQARWLALPPVVRLAWAKERRVAHAVRIDGMLVANVHATSMPCDDRVPDAELLRAAVFADALAPPDEVCVLAGDANVTGRRSRTLTDLAGPDWGFSGPGPGIDHVLVRGAEASPPAVWPAERRTLGGRLLSDHAPLEVRIA